MAGTTNKLTATDRKQLTKVVQGRFELLRDQIASKRAEFEAEARKEVEAESSGAVNKYKAKLNKLAEKGRALEEEGRQLKRDAAADGIKIGSRYSSDSPVEFSVYDNVTAADFNERFSERLEPMRTKISQATYGLRGQELQLIEDIAVAGIETEEGTNFLGKIPTLDDLLQLPANNDTKQLNGAS